MATISQIESCMLLRLEHSTMKLRESLAYETASARLFYPVFPKITITNSGNVYD